MGIKLTEEYLQQEGLVANAYLSVEELDRAKEILAHIHEQTLQGIKQGKGPFYAEIYDEHGNLVAASSNSVVEDQCALHHAEMNVIKLAHDVFKTYDLAPHHLTLYINAEPCVMCAGAIMWSGIQTVFFSVPSSAVERITGFDEGYKPNWVTEFAKRGIEVYGNIEAQKGEQVLAEYVSQNHEIYKPHR